MDENPTFKVKYQFHAMTLNTMTLTIEQLVRFFNTVEALLTEFHSSKGYTTVLAPLIDLTTKKPRANGADGNGD
eukprot:1797786-Amphidinium_carterae.1